MKEQLISTNLDIISTNKCTRESDKRCAIECTDITIQSQIDLLKEFWIDIYRGAMYSEHQSMIYKNKISELKQQLNP